MGYHFDEDTTVHGHPIRNIIRCLEQVRDFSRKPDRALAAVCRELGLLREDPCDAEAFLITDAGNRVRSGKVGPRIPYREAASKLEAFMEELCGIHEDRRPADGIIDQGWLFGSLMRREPTIGDVDLCIHLPGRMKPDPFISVGDSIDLRLMAIPCQEIRISCEAGAVGWELVGEPGPHPACTSLEDTPPTESFRTDQGTFRTGTPDEDTVVRTIETVRTLLDCGIGIPDTVLATLRRDLVARYTDDCHASEPAAALMEPLAAWIADPDMAEEFYDTLAAFTPEAEGAPAPQM